MKTKRKLLLAVVIIIVVSIITGVVLYLNSNKKTEIVWYLVFPMDYGIDKNKIKENQALESEKFDLFNERLDELGIPAKVTFKYDDFEIEDVEFPKKQDNFAMIQSIVNKTMMSVDNLKDNDADICMFLKNSYSKYITLDKYDVLKKLEKVMPKENLDDSRINDKLYMIPKGNMTLSKKSYKFDKYFLNNYNIGLDEEKIKTMMPREVIDYLLQYFKDNKLLDNKYYLTSAEDLRYYNYLTNKKIITEGYGFNIWLDLDSKKIENPIETKEFREFLELAKYIYENDIDAHTNPNSQSASSIFSVEKDTNVMELSSSRENEKEWYKTIYISDYFRDSRGGNGVLKTSDNKDLAVEVLMASIYDEELSNIMIYGVPNKDYELKDGKAIYKSENNIYLVGGTFVEVGNNFIAYPNKLEILDKKEKAFELTKKAKYIPYSNFTPLWDDKLNKINLEVTTIYMYMMNDIATDKIKDLDAFISEYKQKLKDAGVDELLDELQKQVDNWVE